MAYYAPNKFLSLLFSTGTLNGHVENVVEFFCKLSFVTATSFDPSTDNKNSFNIYTFK